MDQDLEVKIQLEYHKISTTSQFHQEVMGDYEGAYAVGISRGEDGRPCIYVSVLPDTAQDFPEHVSLGEYKVPVIVAKNFKPLTPLASSE